MKIGDLVTFTPESWGTPIEDRPLYIVVREPYEITKSPLVRVIVGTQEHLFNYCSLEVINESR